eukprot:CAMPEP_0178988164 /NCGR_PEP_ID=MMETSP0795-20121207/3665_1 /TAXON_ID=88552 /ORGANISM="Amoebophrya sp., Strain Ameob2" /LENGTH=703 /DNA_ID=CAMNT_0020679421 /DNA_START=248 /DNA_END=2359 /DNA_ORIENTATION=+
MSRFDTRQLIAEAENSFETRPWRGTDAPRIDLEPKQTGAIAYLLFFLWCSWQWFVFPESRCMVQNKVVAKSSIPASVEAGVAGLNWKEAHKKTLPRMMAMVDAGALERQRTDDTSSDRVKADIKRSSETPSGMPTPVRRTPATLADFYAQDRTEYHGPPASFGLFKGADTVAPDTLPLSNSATDESKVVAISHGLRKRFSADDESIGELKERPTAFAQIRSRSSLTRGTDAIHSQRRSNGIPKSPAARAAGKQQAEQGEMTSSDGRTTSVSGRWSESAADRHQLRLRGFAPPRASGSWLSVDGEDDDGDELRDDGSYYSRFRQWLAGSFFSVEASPAPVPLGARRASAAEAAGPADSTASEATEKGRSSDGAAPGVAEADTPGAAITLPATTEQAVADARLKQDIEERNVCYLHLIRASYPAPSGPAYLVVAPLQNFYLPHVLFLFAASSFLGFVALTNICKLRGRSTAMLNTIALLWFCFVAYAAIAIVFSYYLPWQVYEPALNSRGADPVAAVLLRGADHPFSDRAPDPGADRALWLPAVHPVLRAFYASSVPAAVLQGGAGSGGGGAWFGGRFMSESRRARLRAQETLARCTSFKLLHEHIVARGEENCCCAICLQDCELAQEVSESPCGHLFHQDCLEKWAQFGGTNCPVCRRNLADPYPGAGGDAPLLNTEERGVTSVAGGPTPGVPLGSVVAGGAEE